MSLRAKLLAVLTVILTLGVGTTGTVLIRKQARHDHALLAEKQLLLVEHAAFALQGNLSVAARELSRLSKLPEIDAADNDLDPERLLLYSAHENSVFFKEVRILDPDGRVSLVQPADAQGMGETVAGRRWFQIARRAHQPFFYTVPEGGLRPEAIGVVVPVRHEGVFGGAIQGIIDLHDDKLTAELRHAAGPEGEFVIVDREGRVIYPAGDHDLGERGWGPAIHELAEGRAGSRHLDDAAGDFMYAWAPVGIGNWGAAMRWSWRGLSAATRSQVASTGAILALGILFVGVIAVGFATYLTRPLLALGAVAERIGRGEHARALGDGEHAIHARRGDEVGALFRAFDHMEAELRARDARIRDDLDTISRLNASLEERVAARTRELEAAQARLLEVERFAAMGKTAAAIAHELRNALNGLGMCVDLVLADRPAAAGPTGAGGASMKVRAQIHREIARLRDVTESLLTFSRTPRIERAPTDVHLLVGRALDVLGETIADGAVAVQLDLAGGGAPLLADCDAYKVQGVLINLIKNAVEAMVTRPMDLDAPDGEAANPPEPPRLRVSTRRRADGAVEIAVADGGPGLLPAAREHLYEPFYTTKVTGTGLGLATAKRVIDAHGGAIDIGSDAALGGACVRVVLPAAVAAVEAAAAAGGEPLRG